MKNILFVTAHPDDLEINAGGTVSALLSQGKQVFTIICSLPIDDTRYIRMNETDNSRKELGFSNLYLLNYEDTKLHKFLDEIINDTDKYIKDNDIDTVFTHHPGDGHQDHYTVSKATAAAARNVDNLIYFRPTAPSTNPGIPFNQNLCIKLSENDISIKIKALECHKSQIKKYGEMNWVYRMKDIARADSWIYSGKHGYAEVFEISRLKL